MTNQCQHGPLARVCLTCEQVAEIERLTATVAGLRESANLRVRYHSAELADVTAERDEAREEVARLKDARVQFSGADAAEIKRLRDQLHLAEVVRAAQVEGLVQAAAGWRERANQLEAQVAGLRKALAAAIRQNEHDMLMTGEELRAARAALGDKT